MYINIEYEQVYGTHVIIRTYVLTSMCMYDSVYGTLIIECDSTLYVEMMRKKMAAYITNTYITVLQEYRQWAGRY